ncbi:MAG: ABC transporter substrate-binding protein [Planctomycetota bacterium]
MSSSTPASESSTSGAWLTLGLIAGLFLLAALGLIGLSAWSYARTSAALQHPPTVSERLTVPCTRDGEPWRLGCYQGGPWVDYPLHLHAALLGLRDRGWLTCNPPTGPASVTALWAWLAEHERGPYLRFVPAACWSAGWRDEQRRTLRHDCLERLRAGELDLVLALGTWAGEDLAVDEHRTPVVLLSASDPIAAGIVSRDPTADLPHVHAIRDPERYYRQASVFHDLIGFQRLGVVYDPSAAGRVWSNLPDLERLAAERGFDLITTAVSDVDASLPQIIASTHDAFAELAPRVDAVWMGAHQGQSPEALPQVIAPLLAARLPTWAQQGRCAVAQGVLLGADERNLAQTGRIYATGIAAMLNGADARQLPQIYIDPCRLVINHQVAERIGFTIPSALAAVADSHPDPERQQ